MPSSTPKGIRYGYMSQARLCLRGERCRSAIGYRAAHTASNNVPYVPDDHHLTPESLFGDALT